MRCEPLLCVSGGFRALYAEAEAAMTIGTVTVTDSFHPFDVGQLVYPLDRAYDAVLLCTGWKFDSTLFASETLPQMSWHREPVLQLGTSNARQPRSRSRKYPALTHAYESPNVQGMYFAGTITHGKDWRKAAGGFIHGFRYTTQALHRVLEHRMHDVPWPHRIIALKEQDEHTDKPENQECKAGGPLLELIQTVRQRINEASALYQMFGQLWDVIVFDPGKYTYAGTSSETARQPFSKT